ncbi:MAG: ACP phosphodiesterase [Planctomycetota bacterium]|nr:ACP phosphodiesterase [Planctomycetota bacterium]MDG1983963.1 ACP phosphodiesterase [Planctomycetota bacterium]
MNYLAHVTLAEPTDEARLGALLGDFARGLDVERLPAGMRFALHEHRALDQWFDDHPRVRAERARFPAELRRFSGILLDVFADHVLARRWDELHPQPVEEVTGSLYRSFETFAHLLPPRLVEVAPRMATEDWLGGYGDRRNIQRALDGIAGRMRRSTPIASGFDELGRRYDEIEACVLEVWPDAEAWLEARRRSLRALDAQPK